MPLVSMCLLAAGGRKRSLYSERASRNARDTSSDVVVVQSTSNGYNPINFSHANVSTENGIENPNVSPLQKPSKKKFQIRKRQKIVPYVLLAVFSS